VSDEPSNGELGRRLDSIQQTLGSMRAEVVGRLEYAADQRAAERQFREIAAGLEEIRRQHTEDIRDVRDELAEQGRARVEHRRHWRELVWQGALPALMTLTVGLLALWAAHSGGH
jgi:hypothetical protein